MKLIKTLKLFLILLIIIVILFFFMVVFGNLMGTSATHINIARDLSKYVYLHEQFPKRDNEHYAYIAKYAEIPWGREITNLFVYSSNLFYRVKNNTLKEKVIKVKGDRHGRWLEWHRRRLEEVVNYNFAADLDTYIYNEGEGYINGARAGSALEIILY